MAKGKVRFASFVKDHSSVLFLFVVLLCGVILFPVGVMLHDGQNPSSQIWSSVITQFAGALTAIALTAFFFSLPDLRKYLANTVVRLISDGDIVSLLSRNSQASFRSRLHLEMVGENAEEAEPTLHAHVEKIISTALGSPYVTNYRCIISVSPLTGDDTRFLEHVSIQYRLHVHHLKSGVLVPIRFYQEQSFPKDSKPAHRSWVKAFSFEVGKLTAGINDIVFAEQVENESVLMTASCSLDLNVHEDVDVSISSTLIIPDHDPVQMVCARYPSQGFFVSLTRGAEFTYDCGWFTVCDPSEDLPAKGRIDTLPNGIQAGTNDWLLPGEGVAVYYYPKKQEDKR